MRDDHSEHVSDIIGHIYDCAIDPSLWSATLARVAAFMESRTVNIDIVGRIPGRQPLTSLLEYGCPPGAVESQEKYLGSSNPLVPASMMYDVDEVFTSR